MRIEDFVNTNKVLGIAALIAVINVVLLTAIGIATAFIGLIITMPLVGHATWHAYRALIAPRQPA